MSSPPISARPNRCYVLGRGPALAIASEAALKFKETSGMHAEAYSAAEVLHGPVALVDAKRFPVHRRLPRATRPKARSPSIARRSWPRRALVVHATSYQRRQRRSALPFVETGHPITDALTLILPFYGFVEAWSRSRGLNPDAPASPQEGNGDEMTEQTGNHRRPPVRRHRMARRRRPA